MRAETTARRGRRRLGPLSGSAILDVATFLRRYHRLRVDFRYGWDDSISAILVKFPEPGRSVVDVNASHPLGRRNFSLAHELSHLALDHGGGTTGKRDPTLEREADWFAVEFLLPAELLNSWCAQLGVRGPRELARRSELSPTMVRHRFAELGCEPISRSG